MPAAKIERLRRSAAKGMAPSMASQLPSALGMRAVRHQGHRAQRQNHVAADNAAPGASAGIASLGGSELDERHAPGRFDAQLQVLCRDVGELDASLFALKDERGEAETNTRLVLRTVEGFPRSLA